MEDKVQALESAEETTRRDMEMVWVYTAPVWSNNAAHATLIHRLFFLAAKGFSFCLLLWEMSKQIEDGEMIHATFGASFLLPFQSLHEDCEH